MRNPDTSPASGARQALALLGWLALTFSAAATGAFVSAGGWYAELAKPAWNPPGWVFGPVWTTLYAMTAVSRLSPSPQRRRSPQSRCSSTLNLVIDWGAWNGSSRSPSDPHSKASQ